MRFARSSLPASALSCTAFLLTLSASNESWSQAAPAPAPVNSRATRDADNPMRVILEAGKLKVRVKSEGDTPAAPAPQRKEPVKPKAAAAAPVAPAAPVATAASAPPEPVAVAAPAPAPVVAPVVPVAAPTPAPAPAADTRTALAAPVAAPPPAVLKPLRNIRMVEPELPINVLRRLRGELEVVVDFTVKPDGSVSDVAVRSSSNKAIDDSVVDAVRQWRYEPLPAARSHTVQLVLRGER